MVRITDNQISFKALRTLFWDEGRQAMLRKLVADNLSSSVIAIQLGCSRSAALGKIYRLRLTNDRSDSNNGGSKSRTYNKSDKKRKSPPSDRLPRAKWSKPTVWHPRPDRLKDPVLDVSLDDADLVPLGVEFLSLEQYQCRWPLDDGKFCGLQVVGGRNQSYCKSHTQKSLTTLQHRRARRF
jgi:hypothetical protein